MGSMAENSILIDEEQDMENSSPSATTPVSERLTRPPALMSLRIFQTRIENVPDCGYRILVEYSMLLLCVFFDKKIDQIVSYSVSLSQKLLKQM